MAGCLYLDLNPVRAAWAESPESSTYTSAYHQIEATQGKTIESAVAPIQAIPGDDVAKILKSSTPEELVERCKWLGVPRAIVEPLEAFRYDTMRVSYLFPLSAFNTSWVPNAMQKGWLYTNRAVGFDRDYRNARRFIVTSRSGCPRSC
ncbi:MAG: hypothetical protein ACK578_15035 [Pirellula sp.]